MDISSYITDKKRETSIIKKFYSQIEGETNKSKIRELELRLLRPKPIERYQGKAIARHKGFKQRSIRLTFKKPEWILRWMKFFRVNSYVEYNSWDVDFIMELIVKLESGRLEWNVKKNCYYLVSRDGERKIKV